MKRISLILGAVLLLTGVFEASAEEALWLRSNSISPDGTKIAFSWQGDIFVVPVSGGRAVQLTTNPAFETSPMWTADGKNIVFCSMREKSKDIFVVPAEGGIVKQLTTWQGAENLLAVLPDGTVLFSTSILPNAEYSGYPTDSQVYAVPLTGGKPSYVTSVQISNMSVNSSGQVLYEDYKGYEDPFRKHHTSSVTRDVWLYTPASGSAKGDKTAATGFSINAEGTFTKLSTFEGEDRNPVFAPDGHTYYYISERSGSMNVWKSNTGAGAKEEQVTFFDTHPVRYLSISGEGTLSFSYNGELYTVKNGGQPVKLSVDVVKDKAESDVQKHTVAKLEPTSFAPSPNGKEVAVVVRGDVYVTSIDYATTRRITDTPEQERDVCFSKDGKTLYYSSERNGHWGIYAASLTEKDDKYFTYSTKVEEKLITEPGQTCFDPAVSPDGRSLAFFRDRTEIVVRDIKSGKEKTVLKDEIYSYQDGDNSFEWSPDSNYIISNYVGGGGWLHDDLATLLSGKAYIDFTPRGQYVGTEPYNKWTKPSCVVMGEDNYSDASAFPYTYRTLGIGKLIGAPVPGTMTAVWWENQIDPTIVFGIPEVGSMGLKEGRYLENMQIEPDILVYNDPASELRGEDKQLEAAVEEMLKEIGPKK